MRAALPTCFAVLVATATFASPRPAAACGGCFVSPAETTQVTGHRMALSVSLLQTTLWDQITYDGDPAEFAWVLPIKGQVQIGLSSDLLFEVLESNTAAQIFSPSLGCAPSGCPNDAAFGAGATGAATSGGGVTVIAQEVVGPYETVQLEATDPAALGTWLDAHGYNIPTEIEPIIASYVSDGFGFLALRLVPGQGVDAMKPIRITSEGASPVLPLRMVAAGTGARTPLTLWVLGEGRYQPQNFSFDVIEASDLVWDWDTSRSNYDALRKEIVDADGGSRWLLEAAEPIGPWVFDQLVSTAELSPEESGYADPMGLGAVAAAEEDVATLLAGIDEGSLWVSRMSAELSRAALVTDLGLAASPSQTPIERNFTIANSTGTPPACPPPPDCGSSNPPWFPFLTEDEDDDSSAASGCGVAPAARFPWEVGAAGALLAACAVMSRRRRR